MMSPHLTPEMLEVLLESDGLLNVLWVCTSLHLQILSCHGGVCSGKYVGGRFFWRVAPHFGSSLQQRPNVGPGCG